MNEVKVLLVDDETGFSSALGKRLAKRGFFISSADSGLKALERLAEEMFDVVLLDIKMTGMDGIKTLSEIKRQYPLVEVLMLTAHANTDIVISSLAMGAFDYLLKPADVDELIRKIDDAMQRRQRILDRPSGIPGED
jgi:DNA-binding NtrC family response regulator